MAQLFFGALTKPEDVIPLLGKQEDHWKEEHSAFETAHSWFAARGLPSTIRVILDSEPTFAGAKLLKAFFEKQTELDDLGRGPSQTDVLAILQIKSGLAVIGVEGKVNETFGPIVRDWHDRSANKSKRLARLCGRLGLRPDDCGSLRYQLLHRTAAALIEAEEAGAHEAVMIVQSFSQHDVGLQDFRDFTVALGLAVTETNKLSEPLSLGAINLRLGWTKNVFTGKKARPRRASVKVIHEGKYAAEIPVVWIEDDSWGPCLSVDDVRKLEEVRKALREGEVMRAANFGRIFHLTPVSN
jgi:hypothetical protein